MTATMRQELQINRGIEARLNEQLKAMQTWMDRTRIWTAGMDVSQTQNLLSVAQDTGSVEVVKNYIRYQIGRDGNSRSWRKGAPGFGEELIREIDRLREVAEGVVPADSPDRERVVDQTWMKLTRRYLGYLHRYFYYNKKRSQGGRS
ncbi:MAG: hypothetical protein GY803_14775 [Chloroflexi bacterium]|nr:hypothetical protein [Chloroflexota bacterium]